MPRLSFARLALKDLDEILDYISEHDPHSAISVVERIYEKCELLGKFPQLGETLPGFRGGNYRVFSVGNYAIIYRLIGDRIEVARVVRGERDVDRLA